METEDDFQHSETCIIASNLESPGQTDMQVDASRRKFAKPELAYGLAMG